VGSILGELDDAVGGFTDRAPVDGPGGGPGAVGDGDAAAAEAGFGLLAELSSDELERLAAELEADMRQAAAEQRFEEAAVLRDDLAEVRGVLAGRR
jgi:excinuclease ABC subunit B